MLQDIIDNLRLKLCLRYLKVTYFFSNLKIVNGFRSRIAESFPWLIDEMQGIADGSQIPFDTVENKIII